jgi:hypothetical protein
VDQEKSGRLCRKGGVREFGPEKLRKNLKRFSNF